MSHDANRYDTNALLMLSTTVQDLANVRFLSAMAPLRSIRDDDVVRDDQEQEEGVSVVVVALCARVQTQMR